MSTILAIENNFSRFRLNLRAFVSKKYFRVFKLININVDQKYIIIWVWDTT